MGQVTRYFAGGNTAEGFVSFFPFVLPEQDRRRMYFIKGGPGVGKSSFMKVIGKEMEQDGYDVEYFYCSGDPECLDAVAIPKLGVGIMDATAPHSYDPVIPGARDTLISLGDYLDERAMSPYLSEIERIGKRISTHYQDSYHYLKAAAELKSMTHNTVKHATIYMEKCLAGEYARRLSEQYVSECTKSASRIGTLRQLFGEAYTHMGYLSHVDVLPREQTILLLEPNEQRLDILLQALAEQTISQGIDIISLHHPLSPLLLSHLYLPEQKVLFTGDLSLEEGAETCGSYHAEGSICGQAVHEENYDDLIRHAVDQLKGAKKAHDELETYYVRNMDFDRVEEKLNHVLTFIKEMK